MAWCDPRFNKKKPKAIKLNKFGETPTDIRDVVPTVRRPSSGISNLSTARALSASSASSSRPPSAGSRTGRPSTARPATARLKSPARPAPLAPRSADVSTPKKVGVSWRTHQGGGLRPPTDIRQLRAPSTVMSTSCPPPCPPDPCPPDPCPQPVQARPTGAIPKISRLAPPSTGSRSLRPPSSYSQRSSAPRPSTSASQAKCQKIVLLPGDIDPTETTIITVEPPPAKKKPKKTVRFVLTKSVKPEWVGPCPEPEPEPVQAPAPQQMTFQFSPPRRRQRPTPCPPPLANSTLRAPSPTRAQSPPRAVCPPDPCPEPCPEVIVCEEIQQEPCPPDPCEEVCPSDPCQPESIPDDLWFEQMLQGTKQPCPSQQSVNTECSENLLDITPPRSDSRGFERVCESLPEELIQWDDPQDPFSPPRTCESPPPQCIDFIGKKDPFSPPTLNEYFSRRYNLPYVKPEPGYVHPMNYRPAPYSPPQYSYSEPCPGPSRRRSPVVIDREYVAKTTPHNRRLSTICKEDSDDDDLGLLPDDVMCLDADFSEPLTRPTRTYDLGSLRQRLESTKASACSPQASSTQPLLDTSDASSAYQQGYDAACRVLERYNRLYGQRPDPCENVEDAGDLGEMTMGDIDFDEIEAVECD